MARLKQAEIPVERVHTVVVTHSHPDHFGGSAQLREVAGADVLTHEAFTSFTAEANDDLEPLIADMTEAEIVDSGRNASSNSAKRRGAPAESRHPTTPSSE